MNQLLLPLPNSVPERRKENVYKKALLFTLLVFCILSWQKAFATHSAGGYLSYQWLYGNTYQITVTFYRDCLGIAAPIEMEIDFNSSCGSGYVDAPQVPPSGTEIGYPCPRSTTCDGGTSPGFQKYVYQVDVTLNVLCTDWVLSFQASAGSGQVLGRNNIITTLNQPLGNLYTQTTLNNVNYPENDAVTFLNDPVLFVCAGQSETFNLGATDSDGDSLTYQLTTAMQSAGVPVSYVFPLSGQNPLFPGAGAVTINSVTGDITINTNTIQVGVIDVLVTEYKNGVQVGSVILDIQVIIQACNNHYPTLTGINGTSVFTDSVCAGNTVSFFVNSHDIDTGQIVTMSWNNGISPPATFSSSGSPYPSGTFTWPTTLSNARSQPYTFTVTVRDNACPNNGSTTLAYLIYVITPTITVNPVAPAICNGQSAPLTAAGGKSYTWSPSTGLSGTTGATITASPSSTTTYTVVGTDVLGCTNTATVTVKVNPLPTITINPAAPSLCNGLSVSLTASGGSTYIWSPSGGLSATSGTTVSANPSSTTTYTVTGTDVNGCTNSKSITVTINPAPVVSVNAPAPVCNGQSVSLTASGAVTYSWSPASGLSATTGSSVNANPTSTTSYIVTGTDINGCTNSKSTTVTINPLPTINVSSPAPICSGKFTSLNASGASTYAWSPASGLSATSGSIVTASPSSTTTYTITGTNVNGCTNSKSVTVIVNPLPPVTVNSPAPICTGLSTSLTANGALTYTWSPASGLSATSGSSVTANPSSTATYTVTGTDANGCSNTKSVIVTINPLPVIGVSPASPLCTGQSSFITASGGATYLWSPGTGLSATTGTTVTANPSSTTTYTVTGTDVNGCTNTNSVTVTINPPPVISVSTPSPLCSGQSTSLTASGGTMYTWSPASGLSAGTGATVTASPSSTTTYIVTGTDANGCTNTNSVTVTINPPPVISVSSPSPICNGQSTSLTASGGTSYAWTPSSGLSATTGATVTASPSSTTVYTVTGTDVNGCTNTNSVTVTINPPPVISVSAPSPICNGQSTSLTASGGTSYTWSPASGLSATTGATVTANPSSTTTYIVTGTDINGCTNTNSVTVTINPPPVISVSAPSPICNGQSTSLTASGGTSYSWSPASGLSAGTGATVTASPSSTTTYIVTGTDVNGCTNTNSVTVTINPPPVISVNTPSPICNGQSASLTASGGTSYSWSPASGLSAITGATVTASPSSTTSYIVIGTDADGCTNTNSVTVTINPPPVISVSTPSLLCNGQSTSLTASGGTSYSWSPASGLSATTGATVTANPSSTTTYIVTGTDINGCTNTNSVTVTINPPPVISVSTPSPICNGQSTSLTASGGTSYSWSPASGLSAGTGATVTASPSSTTTYIVTGTDVNGCTNTNSVTVTINPPPVISVNTPSPICNGQSASLTASGGTSYSWSPASGLSAITGATVTASPSSTTSYIVIGTDANGCTNTNSVTVTINPPPVISVSTPSLLCNGQSASLTASGGTSYTWTPDSGLSTTTGATVTASPASTTIYTVTGTDINGCTNTNSVTVTINPLPVISVSSPSPLCNGESATLTASGGTSYSWSPASGLSATTGATVTANPSSTTTYIVTGTDVNGCTNTNSVTVTINPPPVISVNTPSPICNGQSASLTASGGTSYSWSPASGLSTITGATVPASPSSTTSYIVIGTDANGCTNTNSVTVTINPPPVISVSTPSLLCNGQSASLTASGGTSYTWTPDSGLSANTGATVTATPSSTTTYIVTGTDVNGCTNTKSVTVTINPPPVISVSTPSPLCNGQSASLTSSGGTSYTWSPASGLSASTGATVTASPSSTTTYTVTGTDVNGCTNTKSVTVTINPPPVISVSTPSPLCNGQSASLTASGGTSYIWSPASGLSSTTGATVTANPSSTTTYIVTGTDANGCTNTNSVTVTINPLPVISVSTPSPLCSGQSASLTASGGTSYTWAPSSGLSTSTGATVNASPASTTVYTVTGTDINGCTNTNSVTVTINPPPVISVSTPSPLCNGQSASLTASGGTSYIWSPASGLSSTTGATVTANPSSTTTYIVTGTDANGCTNTNSVTVTINPPPVISVSAPSPVCSGQSASLTASGGTTYTWTPASGLSANTGATVTATPSSTTTYIVTGTDVNGCTNTNSVTVTINPPPVISVSTPSPLCNGQSASLTGSGGSTYAWSPATGLSATTGATVTAYPSSTTSYIVTGTDAYGCSNSSTVTVTINPLPIITVSPVAPVLCSSQSVSLTASGGTMYTWSPASGLSATTGAIVTATPLSTSTFIVTGTDANGCNSTASVTITIITNPDITISPVTPLCIGQSVSMTASGANTYTWSPSTGLSGNTGATVTANPSSTITYTVTGTASGGCSGTNSITVTINPLPVITVSPVPPLCNGQSASLTAAGGTTYTWSPASGLSGTTGSTVNANPSSTTIYTVTGTDANGCSNTKSETVTINPLPVISVSSPSPLCNGESATLTASGGTSYSWSPASGLSATTGATVTANPSSTTTYTVTGTDVNGCSNTASVIVTINPLPVIGVSLVSPMCIGQSAPLTASGGTTYAWSPGIGLSATTGLTVTANPFSTTTYTVTGTDVNGCSNTASVMVTINPLPVIGVSLVTPMCIGQSAPLTASGGTTYAWSPGIGLSATTGLTVTANPFSTTTYTVTGTDVNGCSNTASVTVTINPLPVIAVSPISPMCIGQSAPLTASGGTTYAWSPGTGLSATTGVTVTANPSSTIIYTITGTDINGCSNTKSVTVTVNPLPVIMVSPFAPVLCSSQSVSLTASGGTTYIWSPSSGLSGTTGTTVTATPPSTSTYIVTGTDVNGCSNTASVTITIITNPVITISPVTPLCVGQSVSMTASGANTYAWSPSTGLSANKGDTVTANPSSTITYTVTGTATGGCFGTTAITVTVNPVPVISVSPVPGICNGQSTSLTAIGGSIYIWSPASGLSSTTGATVSASPSGTITYSVTGTDVNGCTNTSSVTVKVNPLPVISVTPVASAICGGQSVSLTASGASSYAWSPATGLSSGTGSTVSANPDATFTYNVTGTDANGCTNTATVTVTVNSLPVVSVIPIAPAICVGQSISLTASGASSYMWSPTTGLSLGTGATVSANPTVTTAYNVTGTDGNGCSNTAHVTLTVNPLPVITITPGNPAICIGQSVSLKAGGATSYIWNPITGLSSGTGDTVLANPATNITYNVTGTDGNGCSNTSSVAVTVNPLPVVNAGPDATICPNASAQINVTGPPPGSTYTWSPSTNLSCNNCPNPSASPLITTIYIVIATTSSGCSAQDTIAINVKPISVSAGPDTTVCYGSSVQLHAGGGSMYLWSPSAGLSDASIDDPIAYAESDVTYTVTVSSGVCNSTATASVQLFPITPYPNLINKSDTLYCTINPIYKSYQWYFNSSIIPNATLSYYLALKTGNYNVAITDTNGCSISVGINIVVTGVNTLASGKIIDIYPNPATNQLFINGYGDDENTLLIIYNLIGEKTLVEKIKESDHTSIDLQNIAAGIYFIEIQWRDSRWVGRFVKE